MFTESKHVAYIMKVAADTDSFEYEVSQHFRMSGIYWGLTAMSILGRDLQTEMASDSIIDWVMLCRDGETGGFGGSIGHDPHLLYTLSAIQILALLHKIDRLEDVDKTAKFIASMQKEDGSFMGDKWGEIDTRFTYCALSALSILGKLRSGYIDVEKSMNYIISCRNFDGGFGAVPGGESHAGQIFCCIGALSIGGALEYVDENLLGWWLCERQCDSGGLNGRPEKQADVCYSWWILSSLSILGRTAWIDKNMLIHFIIQCQDCDDGGIADRPGIQLSVVNDIKTIMTFFVH
jgi:geranylgeranyl transferase type-2 subunit beta